MTWNKALDEVIETVRNMHFRENMRAGADSVLF